MKERTWTIFVDVVTVVWIGLFVASFLVVNKVAEDLCADLMLCLLPVFVADLILIFRKEESLGTFLRKRWFDILLVIPYLRIFRILRFARLLKVLRLVRAKRALGVTRLVNKSQRTVTAVGRLKPGVIQTNIHRDVEKIMREGAIHLMQVLEPLGFSFRVVRTGPSSGGRYCEAELSCGDRRIELHYRGGLGMVRYHIGDVNVSHEAYLTALGAAGDRQYPGFYGDDPMAAFRSLAHDFGLIRSDFLDGNGRVLAQAAAVEAKQSSDRDRQLMIDFVGDRRIRSQARQVFRTGNYAAVVKLLRDLEYPDDLSPAETKMLAIARKYVDSG